MTDKLLLHPHPIRRRRSRGQPQPLPALCATWVLAAAAPGTLFRWPGGGGDDALQCSSLHGIASGDPLAGPRDAVHPRHAPGRPHGRYSGGMGSGHRCSAFTSPCPGQAGQALASKDFTVSRCHGLESRHRLPLPLRAYAATPPRPHTAPCPRRASCRSAWRCSRAPITPPVTSTNAHAAKRGDLTPPCTWATTSTNTPGRPRIGGQSPALGRLSTPAMKSQPG